MGRQKRMHKRGLGLRKETLAAIGGLDAADLARVAGGGSGGSVVCGSNGGGAADEETVAFTASGASLSGSRKC